MEVINTGKEYGVYMYAHGVAMMHLIWARLATPKLGSSPHAAEYPLQHLFQVLINKETEMINLQLQGKPQA